MDGYYPNVNCLVSTEKLKNYLHVCLKTYQTFSLHVQDNLIYLLSLTVRYLR